MQNQSPSTFCRLAFATLVASLTATPLALFADVHDPGQAVENLDVHPELDVQLFAHEPMVINPSNIDVDPAGRVWVCEIVNYRRFRNPKALREEGDRIVILTDSDQDGLADKQTVFYQKPGFESPHGICVLATPNKKGTKVIVSAGENVMLLTDSDGDDKADQEKLLFTGIGGTQHDHGIHAFLFGPDGKLYFNFGNEGKQLKDAKGNLITDLAGNEIVDNREPYQQGMIFRCDLDGSNVETLAWNFRNNWELTVDSFGTIWQSDNDDDGNRGVRINYVMEFGNYGYRDELTGAGWQEERTGMADDIPSRHWHVNDPGVVPNLLQTGAGSPTGIAIYEGELLPQVFQNQVIHCDAGPSICRAYPVEIDGAGYSAEIVNMLDGSQKNNWFRPSDVAIAPDGSLFVADWYDPGVGGHAAGDLGRGRIFRVIPKDHDGSFQPPQFDFDSVAGCIEALKNPSFTVRYVAWMQLQEFGDEAVAPLEELAKHENPRFQARALWLLGKLPGQGLKAVQQASQSKDPNLRIMAIRLVRQLARSKAHDSYPRVKWEHVADDPSPAVRRECAIALADLDPQDKPAVWAKLARQYSAGDRWYLEALGIAARGDWDACLDAWLEAVGDDYKTPAGRDIIWRSRGTKTPSLLVQIIQDEATPEEEADRYFRAFDFLDGPEKEEALINLLGN